MKMYVYQRFIIVVGLLMILLAPALSHAAPPPQGPAPSPLSDQALVDQLKQLTQGAVRISHHAETGKVRFIGASAERSVAQPSVLGLAASPEDAARGFLAVYGNLFGLDDAYRDLTVMKERSLADGRNFVRFQQTYQGIPIIGGEVIVQVGAGRDIISTNGELLPDLDLDISPRITAETARQTALTLVTKNYDLSQAELTTSEPELWIYNPMLMGGPGLRFNTLVWRVEVTPLELAPIDEFVLIDAHVGAVTLNFNQTHIIKNRQTYDANNLTTLPGTLVCNEGNPLCAGGDAHEVAAHTYAGDTYDYYFAEHGRDSINNAGMTMISTVHFGVNFANAFWNGSQMVYGDAFGFAQADDVVAHELTHGVTNFESNLFYYYQSGSINESLSDVWGEFVDQNNGAGTDTAGVRWQMGEDVTGLGAIRNMQNPPLFNDPDRMTSPNYVCDQTELSTGDGDNGGVHSNSGVNNKAAYLMTDGDTFNGQTVTGLGHAKVADLYYEVQTNMLTSAADYADLYDALIQASINLGFSAADQQEVKDALAAVEMNQPPPTCQAPHAPRCDSGFAHDIFFDDIESGGGNWTVGSNSGLPAWFVPQTASTIGLPGPYATSGRGNIHGFAQGNPIGGISDTFLAMNSDVPLPADAYLHFNHAFGFESTVPLGFTRYDGGILEYSTNGGVTWSNAGGLFTHNGYNSTLEPSNPLGGISAFGADSRGYISSRLDLGSLAGQNIRFRFRMGTDEFLYDYGWFIDDVRIYTCQPTIPKLTISKTTPTTAHAGQPLTYAISLENTYDLTATGVVLTDSVPANTTLNPASLSGDATHSGTSAGSLITWNIGSVNYKQVVNRTFMVTVDSAITAGQVVNTAYVSATNVTFGSNDTVTTPIGNTYLPFIIK